MKVFRWDNEKNERLKKESGVCFEQVVILMEREDVFDAIENPNQDKYPGQKIALSGLRITHILFHMCKKANRYS